MLLYGAKKEGALSGWAESDDDLPPGPVPYDGPIITEALTLFFSAPRPVASAIARALKQSLDNSVAELEKESAVASKDVSFQALRLKLRQAKASTRDAISKRVARWKEDRAASQLQEWAKVIPLLSIEIVRSDPQLLSMWRRGLPPSARGALWCMAIGNSLGLTDEDFDSRVTAANASAASAADTEHSASVSTAAAADSAVAAAEVANHDADDIAEREATLRNQIEMDLQRTMPR